MNYDFDRVIDRRSTSSDKWGKYRGRDIIPIWVADSDFQACQPVIDALAESVRFGVFGYSLVPDSLVPVTNTYLARHGLRADAEQMLWMPGLVCALSVVARLVAQRGGSRVGVPRPIYPPFFQVPNRWGLEAVEIPMPEQANGRMVLDFDELRAQAQQGLDAFFLCNPQNPGGTVWTQEELQQLLQICQDYDVLVCSDEVHCDLMLDQSARHISYATLSDYARDHSITLLSPSKAFNLAGLGCALALVHNDSLREEVAVASKNIVPEVTIPGYVAAEAAWRDGWHWLEQQLEYLRGNEQLFRERMNATGVFKVHPLQATYLSWVNCADLPCEDVQGWFEAAGVGPAAGEEYLQPGYARFNLGCSRTLLEQALQRIESVL